MKNSILIKYGIWFLCLLFISILVIDNKIQVSNLKKEILSKETEIKAKTEIIEKQKATIESISIVSKKISTDLNLKNQEIIDKNKQIQSLVNKNWNKETYIKNTCNENVKNMKENISDLLGKWK